MQWENSGGKIPCVKGFAPGLQAGRGREAAEGDPAASPGGYPLVGVINV